jgi:hypothetical protein
MACITSGSVPATQAPPASAIAPDAPDVTIAASTERSSAILAWQPPRTRSSPAHARRLGSQGGHHAPGAGRGVEHVEVEVMQVGVRHRIAHLVQHAGAAVDGVRGPSEETIQRPLRVVRDGRPPPNSAREAAAWLRSSTGGRRTCN